MEKSEKNLEKPVTVSATQKDEPAIQETSFCKYLQTTILTVT